MEQAGYLRVATRNRISRCHFLFPSFDPTKDEAAPAVIAAHRAAMAEGKSNTEGYLAGVEAWRRIYPDHTLAYASTQATEVIIRATLRLRSDA